MSEQAPTEYLCIGGPLDGQRLAVPPGGPQEVRVPIGPPAPPFPPRTGRYVVAHHIHHGEALRWDGEGCA